MYSHVCTKVKFCCCIGVTQWLRRVTRKLLTRVLHLLLTESVLDGGKEKKSKNGETECVRETHAKATHRMNNRYNIDELESPCGAKAIAKRRPQKQK